ncbi:MAG: MMPL family transporter [Methylotenera sp.]|nr:MMPL family transporter [Oligoflexia bacterium]
MNFFTRVILRRAGWITILGSLLSYAGGYYSVQLYKNLRTDIEELLPTTARSVVDLNQVKDRLESIDNLAVLVFSKDTQASRRFVTELSHRLEKAPKDTIASVEYNISKELQFFKERRALYMDLVDLKKVRDYVRDRISYEKSLYNPLTIFSSQNIPEPRLDLMGLQKKYDGKASAYSRFPGGYYTTPDETKRVVLVNLPGNASGVAGTHRLKDYVVRTIAELKPESYAADIEIKYTGGVQNNIEEQSALIADLELSTVVVMLLVSIAMLIFFRAPRAVFALLASLLMGTVWTFGASYFAVGYLNANSAFLGSIVLGNGINFGIIFIARYLEERRNYKEHSHALDQAMTHTATSTWTAALAAGLSYGSLSLTSFRGFTQFGIIGLIGMVLCWISAFTLLPAFLTLLDRMKSLGPKQNYQHSKIAGWFAEWVSRHSKLISFASLALTVVALGTSVKYTPKILETDLSRLRNKESMERGSGYLSKYVDEIFNRYLSPMVILPKTREDAIKIAEALKKKQAEEGKSSLIASVQTIDDFIPKDQPEKIAVLREIKKLLPERIFVRLPKVEQANAREFLTPQAMLPLDLKDLPGLVLTKFTEKDGSVGKMVLVEPPLTQETLDGNNLIHFIRDLRTAADAVSPGTPVAGSLPISSDMIESITKDGPKATLFAFLAVVILIVILFRKLNTIVPVLTALLMGVIWLGGIILGFGVKINFLNFIALPITFGIGVDYGVNIFQRYREEGGQNIVKVIGDTGGAVALCSFTTATGYASLLIAQNQAFVSFGLLAVLGEVTCIVAAIVSLPALLLTFSRRRV